MIKILDKAIEQIRQLSILEFDLVIASSLREIIRSIEHHAIDCGAPAMVACCQLPTDTIDLSTARLIVSECKSHLPGSELLTAKDLSTMLAVSERTVWRMKAAQELPESVKVAGAVRWKRKDIEGMILNG